MNKKNVILGGILVVLVTVAYLYSNPYKEWRKNASKPNNILSAIQIEKVSKISLSGGGQDIAFGKVGDKWLIEGTKDFYLKDDVATNIIDKFTEATKAEVEVASENIDKKNDFQTNPETGITVVLSEGDNELKSVIVGKLSNDFTSTYISKSNDDKTYIFKTDLRSAINRQDWYNMAIFDNDIAAITKIRFQYPNREFTVEKDEDTWKGTLPYVFRVDDNKIETIANLMSKIVATEIPKQVFDNTGLDKHEIIVQATGDGIDNTLMIGDMKNNEDKEAEVLYFAKKGDSDNIYLITEAERNELVKQIWELK